MHKINTKSALGQTLEMKRLVQRLKEKEGELLALIEKKELLGVELARVKREYDMRMGKLYLQLDLVNLEIQKLEQTQNLIDKGYEPDEASRVVEEYFEQEAEKIKFQFEEKPDQEDKNSHLTEEAKIELRNIWRRLAHNFHPDLALSETEKRQKEEIMKQINRAYAEGDLETLTLIDSKQKVSNPVYNSPENLEKHLVEIIVAMAKVKSEYLGLLKSEWNIWRENLVQARRENRDMFGELELKIKMELKQREKMLAELLKK